MTVFPEVVVTKIIGKIFAQTFSGMAQSVVHAAKPNKATRIFIPVRFTQGEVASAVDRCSSRAGTAWLLLIKGDSGDLLWGAGGCQYSFTNDPRNRAAAFCDRFGLRQPILLAPMAGACAPSLSISVMRVGGFGACAALLMQPNEIEDWPADVRANVDGPFQINLWMPGPLRLCDRSQETRVPRILITLGFSSS